MGSAGGDAGDVLLFAQRVAVAVKDFLCKVSIDYIWADTASGTYNIKPCRHIHVRVLQRQSASRLMADKGVARWRTAVRDLVGAFGSTHFTPSSPAFLLQPSMLTAQPRAVSPRPWEKMTVARARSPLASKTTGSG